MEWERQIKEGQDGDLFFGHMSEDWTDNTKKCLLKNESNEAEDGLAAL